MNLVKKLEAKKDKWLKKNESIFSRLACLPAKVSKTLFNEKFGMAQNLLNRNQQNKKFVKNGGDRKEKRDIEGS